MRLMGKLFKVAIVLLIILGVIGAALVFFLNPNNFKQQANKLLQQYTGQAFEITGSLSYSVWPKLILKASDINLKSPLITIKEADIYLDPYSLMGKHPVIYNLELSEVSVTLDNLAAIPALPATNKLSIQAISVEKSKFILKNDATKQDWELRDLSLTAKNLELGTGAAPQPIAFTGNLVDVTNSLSIGVDAVFTADAAKETLSLKPMTLAWNNSKAHGDMLVSQYLSAPSIAGNLTVDQTNIGDLLKKVDPYFANNEDANANPSMLEADITYNYSVQDQIIDFSKLDLKLDGGTLNGTLKLKISSPYRAEFDLTADKLNCEPLIMLGRAAIPHDATAEPSNELIPVELLKTLTLSGKLAGSNVQVTPDFLIDNVTATIIAENGNLQLTPVVLTAYKGTHNLSLVIDATTDTPSIKFTEQSDSFPLDSITKVLKLPKLVSGDAQLKLSIDTQGNTLEAIEQAMNGGINLDVTNGAVYGFDVGKLIVYLTTTIDSTFEQLPNKKASIHDLLQPVLGKWLDTQKDNPASSFDSLEFKAEVQQGVSQSSSFDLNSAVYEFKGDGSFDIVKNTINYTGSLSMKSDAASNLKDISDLLKSAPLSVPVTGSFVQPVLAPDIEGYTTDILKQTRTVLIKKAASSMLAAAPDPSDKTSKSADEIFLDSLKALYK